MIFTDQTKEESELFEEQRKKDIERYNRKKEGVMGAPSTIDDIKGKLKGEGLLEEKSKKSGSARDQAIKYVSESKESDFVPQNKERRHSVSSMGMEMIEVKDPDELKDTVIYDPATAKKVLPNKMIY